MSDLIWQKSSFSGDPHQNCVELASSGEVVCLRESDDPAAELTAHPARVAALLVSAKTGRFDRLA